MTKIEYQKQVLKEIFKDAETGKTLHTQTTVLNENSPVVVRPIRAIAFEDAYKYVDYRSNVNYPGYEGL